MNFFQTLKKFHYSSDSVPLLTIQYDLSLKKGFKLEHSLLSMFWDLLHKRWECISCTLTLLIYAPNNEHFFKISHWYFQYLQKKHSFFKKKITQKKYVRIFAPKIINSFIVLFGAENKIFGYFQTL